jgi:hypothetical protein
VTVERYIKKYKGRTRPRRRGPPVEATKIVSLPPKAKTPTSVAGWWNLILQQHANYSCYALFLLLPADDHARRYLADFGRELDLISGDTCLVLALGKIEFRRIGFDELAWRDAIEAQVEAGYSVRIAELFSINVTEFPALLIFGHIDSPEHVLVSLKGLTTDEIVQNMRSTFAVITRAVFDKQSPLKALERFRQRQKFQKAGRRLVSGIRSLVGSTFKTAVEAWIKVLVGPGLAKG